LSESRAQITLLVVALVALAVLPAFADKFYVQFFAKIMVMAIFAMSLDLLLGYTGLVSFGHAAFYGAAGYALALMTPQYQAANFWTSFPVAIIAAGVLALVIGYFVVRTHGIYFIMVTLAFAQMLYFLFHDTKIAGGNDGIYIDVRPVAEIFGWRPFSLDNFVHRYYLVLVALIVAYFLLRALLRSPFGHVIVGIKVNEHRMASLGYPTFRYKLVCFVIAGAIAGAAGYLYSVDAGVVNPEYLGWHLSGAVMMMVILGGMGTLIGPMLGAAVWLLLELFFQSTTKHWQLLMGTFVVLATLFLPNGLMGVASWLRGRKDLPSG
jgi:branched-chain amino acid transport system permease protein